MATRGSPCGDDRSNGIHAGHRLLVGYKPRARADDAFIITTRRAIASESGGIKTLERGRTSPVRGRSGTPRGRTPRSSQITVHPRVKVPWLSLGEYDGVAWRCTSYIPSGQAQRERYYKYRRCSTQRVRAKEGYAEEVISAKNSHQEDKEDSEMMWLIVVAFVVVIAYIRYLDKL